MVGGVDHHGVVVGPDVVEGPQNRGDTVVQQFVEPGVIVQLAQPGVDVFDGHVTHHVLPVADVAPGPLDLGLGVEVVVEVVGQSGESPGVDLLQGFKVDLAAQHVLVEEVEHAHQVGVGLLE